MLNDIAALFEIMRFKFIRHYSGLQKNHFQCARKGSDDESFVETFNGAFANHPVGLKIIPNTLDIQMNDSDRVKSQTHDDERNLIESSFQGLALYF